MMKDYIKYIKSTTPKNVVIIGWLGAFNLGDEMMLDVTMRLMKKYKHNITLLTHKNDEEVERRYFDVAKIIPRRPLTKEILQEAIRDNDILFVNGGALIDDRYYGNPGSLAWDIARLARGFIDNNKRVIVYGVSTNVDLKDEQLKDDYRYIIDNAEYFSVRDEFSRNELAKISKKRIDVVDDIVFADKIITRSQDNPVKNDSIIGVTLVLDNDTIDDTKLFFDKLISSTDRPIRLISFYDEDNNDARMIDKLRDRLGDKNKYRIRELLVPRNSSELYNSLRGVGLYVSMRYHGILFAGAINKKVICLNYDKHPHYYNKNRYLKEAYDMNIPMVDLSMLRSMGDDMFYKNILGAKRNPLRFNVRPIHRRASRSLKKVIRSI